MVDCGTTVSILNHKAVSSIHSGSGSSPSDNWKITLVLLQHAQYYNQHNNNRISLRRYSSCSCGGGGAVVIDFEKMTTTPETGGGGGGIGIQQYSVRQSRKSWSLSESDASSLTTVDEEAIFLFDEDLKSQPPSYKIKTAPANESSIKIQNDLDDDTTIALNLDSNRKHDGILFHRRLHFYSDNNLSGCDIASSADSEQSISMSIEGLRDHLHSCFTCGVVWRENQVSLDCLECDGYALNRPCPNCDGNCAAVWTRDLASSHQTRKAKWIGKCFLQHETCAEEEPSL